MLEGFPAVIGVEMVTTTLMARDPAWKIEQQSLPGQAVSRASPLKHHQ